MSDNFGRTESAPSPVIPPPPAAGTVRGKRGARRWAIVVFALLWGALVGAAAYQVSGDVSYAFDQWLVMALD